MKIFNYALGFIMLGIFASCGGGSDSVTLSVEPQLGEIGDFISISDNELIVNLKEEKIEGEDVKSIVSSFNILVTKGIQTDSKINFAFMVLDKDHNEISRLPSCSIEDTKYEWDNEPYRYILTPGNYRIQIHESESLEDWKENNSQEYWDKIRKDGKFVEIKISSSYLEFAPYTSLSDSKELNLDYNSSNEADEIEEADGIEETNGIEGDDEIEEDSKQSTSSSTDNSALLSEFNEALNEYKSLTNEAIALSKKVKAGDENAKLELIKKSGECTKMAAKIVEMAKKLDDPKLMAKYQKINLEYMNGLK